MDATEHDEAVRRLREESARRMAQVCRRRVISWCALAGLAGGIALAALIARDARVPPGPPAVAAPKLPPRVEVEVGPVSWTRPPTAPPAVNAAPKNRRCYMWEDDLFEPFVRRCVAWSAASARERLTRPPCGGTNGPSKHVPRHRR
jgi:hypothetical protein